MGKITRTWSLMSACWQVLKEDKALLVFPLISGVCCLALLASFALPLFFTGHWMPPHGDGAQTQKVLYYGLLFLFYVCNYFVVVFFNAALVACAASRLTGGNPTIGDGFRMAASRLPVIFGWAVVCATVGLILRVIEDRSEKVGQIVAGLMGAAWTLVSFLVVPILVVENKNPVLALRDSTAMLKHTWGEQLASNFSFGLIFSLLSVPAFVAIFASVVAGFSHHLALAVLGVTGGVFFLIALALVQSALQAIFQTALYLYARDGQVPNGFQAELLSGAIG